LNHKDLSRKHITEAIDVSLKRLGTDFVDLYIIHRFDPITPVKETIEALDDVVHAGKALYLGASSMRAWQFKNMVDLQHANGIAPFVSLQNYINLIYREEEREMLRSAEHMVLPSRPGGHSFGMGSEQDYAIAERVNTVGGSGASWRRLRWHGCTVCPA
jgi:1-deoxyxylulose-5-phosphate synthase